VHKKIDVFSEGTHWDINKHFSLINGSCIYANSPRFSGSLPDTDKSPGLLWGLPNLSSNTNENPTNTFSDIFGLMVFFWQKMFWKFDAVLWWN